MSYRTPGFGTPLNGPWRRRTPIFGFSGRFVLASRQRARYARSEQDSSRVWHAAGLCASKCVNPRTKEIGIFLADRGIRRIDYVDQAAAFIPWPEI